MSVNFSFEFEWDETWLDTWAETLVAAEDDLALLTAEQIAEVAIEAVPVDTGSLQGTIDVEQTGPGMASVNAGNVEGGGVGGGQFDKAPGYPVDYAAAVEYGTASWGGKPFMTPAAEQGEDLAGEVAALLLGGGL